MPNNPYYVFDDQKCKAESMTKEQIINAIVEATGVTPENIDDGFITTILETNKNKSVHFWKGTKAEYEQIATKDANTFYLITNDSEFVDFVALINALAEQVENLSSALNDTGWQDIIENGKTYGHYRIKQGIAYFDFWFNCQGETGDDVEVSVPFFLDAPLGSFDIPAEYPSVEYYYSTTGESTGINNRGKIKFIRGRSRTVTWIIFDIPTNCDQIQAWFSYPVVSN